MLKDKKCQNRLDEIRFDVYNRVYTMNEELFSTIEGYDWDKHNTEKILHKHGVLPMECEEALLGDVIVVPDEKHSSIEQRYNALSATFAGKMLFIVFTIRNKKIRIISARPMNKKEREVYNEKIKDAPEI